MATVFWELIINKETRTEVGQKGHQENFTKRNPVMLKEINIDWPSSKESGRTSWRAAAAQERRGAWEGRGAWQAHWGIHPSMWSPGALWTASTQQPYLWAQGAWAVVHQMGVAGETQWPGKQDKEPEPDWDEKVMPPGVPLAIWGRCSTTACKMLPCWTWRNGGSLPGTIDQALSLWSGNTDSKTLDYQRTNPKEYQVVWTHTKETTWIQDPASPNHP